MATIPTWTLTLAQAPLAVGKRLTRRGLEHHLFKLKVRRLRRGQMRDEVTPAFGRYVFTRVEPARREELRQVLGVYGFVRDGSGAPAQVSDSVVSELLTRAPSEILPTPEQPCGFRHGERVIVHGAGLVAGYFGIFQHPVDDEHAVIEQEWLGRTVSVKGSAR